MYPDGLEQGRCRWMRHSGRSLSGELGLPHSPGLERTQVSPSDVRSGQCCVVAVLSVLWREWHDSSPPCQRQQKYGRIRRKCSEYHDLQIEGFHPIRLGGDNCQPGNDLVPTETPRRHSS